MPWSIRTSWRSSPSNTPPTVMHEPPRQSNGHAEALNPTCSLSVSFSLRPAPDIPSLPCRRPTRRPRQLSPRRLSRSSGAQRADERTRTADLLITGKTQRVHRGPPTFVKSHKQADFPLGVRTCLAPALRCTAHHRRSSPVSNSLSLGANFHARSTSQGFRPHS
jgi:hypothetical protein